LVTDSPRRIDEAPKWTARDSGQFERCGGSGVLLGDHSERDVSLQGEKEVKRSRSYTRFVNDFTESGIPESDSIKNATRPVKYRLASLVSSQLLRFSAGHGEIPRIRFDVLTVPEAQ
jgi:hypothetical protein